jgi:hypothetical protein
MTVRCPVAAADGCRGTIVLRAAGAAQKKTEATGRAPARARARAARCARGCRPLGQAKFDVKGGKRRRVAVKLSASGRGALAHASSVKARATVTTVIDGKTTTATRTVTLRQARPPAA